MRKRWKVQGFFADVVGQMHGYQPRYFRTGFFARRFEKKLWRSGLYVEVERA